MKLGTIKFIVHRQTLSENKDNFLIFACANRSPYQQKLYSKYKNSSHPSRTVVKITIEVPDELSEQLDKIGDRLPELLRLSLQQPALPAHIYHYILDFLTSQPTPEQILAFRPTSQMQERLRTLLKRSKADELTPQEQNELDEYERIEHLMILLKTGSLPYLTATHQ